MVSNNRLKQFLVADELHDYVDKQVPPNPSNSAIEVHDATLSWDRSEQTGPTLHNLSFTVPRNQLVVVVGTVGSGKSSLLMSLLGLCNFIIFFFLIFDLINPKFY